MCLSIVNPDDGFGDNRPWNCKLICQVGQSWSLQCIQCTGNQSINPALVVLTLVSVITGKDSLQDIHFKMNITLTETVPGDYELNKY